MHDVEARVIDWRDNVEELIDTLGSEKYLEMIGADTSKLLHILQCLIWPIYRAKLNNSSMK